MNGFKGNFSISWTLVVLAFFIIITGCAGVQTTGKPVTVPEIRPGLWAGYLPINVIPNSKALISQPPAEGSTALKLDEDTYRQTRSFRGTPRWELAYEDANLAFPQAAGIFSCALKTSITEKDTPSLYSLLRRTLNDAVLSTYTAKNQYERTRPFVVNKESSCTPAEEKRLMNNGSYPSGHTAIGWAWALILTEIDPENSNAILARGRAFGESRVICGVHWQSDVVEGRFMGAATVARLHADPTFRADLEAAKGELAAVRAKGFKPMRDCEAEAKAMAFQPPKTP